ncbi:hypothetical protein AM587_10005450 [Phytophthora nicotianae]|uniref:Uncharacterized protein n=1 Tax=Phytophthora nicotianae TaxID=4792 RepID=A0A0W8CCW3_PHYNI|nr:hypothetical protein AM587_10005450 [Phytophthora nicotianae]
MRMGPQRKLCYRARTCVLYMYQFTVRSHFKIIDLKAVIVRSELRHHLNVDVTTGTWLRLLVPFTGTTKTLKKDNGPALRSNSSHYLRKRQAMRAPLLPVRGMSMAKGSETAYTMLQDTTSASNAKPRRKQTRKLPSDKLPTEAAALKRRIWDSHPDSFYKFRLDKMKRVVIPPVEIPPPLSDPTLFTYTVSGKTAPMTRLMWQQHRDLLKAKRLPSRIREGIAY